jgi:very-short-patch-repair endonuclease
VPAPDAPEPADAAVVRLAARQHGVVDAGQLAGLGLRGQAVTRRVRSARLHRVHHGVYAIVPARLLSADGAAMAAVLAAGPHAVLSHRAAAVHWRLCRPRPDAPPEVTTPRHVRGPAAVVVHRTRRLDPVDVTRRRAVPVTTVARTLVDLAEVVDDHTLGLAFHEAEVQRLLGPAAVEDVLRRLAGRRRAAAVRRALADRRPGDGPSRSVLEDAFLRLVADAGLPAPRVNTAVALPDGTLAEVDFLWPALRLCVETDGRAAHATHLAFERDRRRDAALTLAGFVPVRFTARQVLGDPAGTAATLRALVAGRRDAA